MYFYLFSEDKFTRNSVATINLNVGFIMSNVGSAYSKLCDIVGILNRTFTHQLMLMILTSYLYNIIFGYLMSTSGQFMNVKFFSTGIIRSTYATLISFITIASISFAADSVLSQVFWFTSYIYNVSSKNIIFTKCSI